MSVDITIQETVNEVDITVNQNVIAVNVTRTTGSGGVESVTGTLVDNTDPNNPVINTPNIPTKTSDLTNDGENNTSTFVESNELGAVAFSNDYNDLGNKPTIPSLQNLTQTLAIDNKTNDIPIVSNNGKGAVDINDAYASFSYDTQSIGMTDAEFQVYSNVPLQFDSNVSTDFNTPILNYNSKEVATQDWVTSQGYGTVTPSTLISTDADNALVLGTDSKLFVPESGGGGSAQNSMTPSTTLAPTVSAVLTEYDMITGLTFSGVFSLDKKGGRSYLPYTQTGSLTLSIGGSPIVGGLAVLRFTANGSAISGYSSWKLLSSDAITATNGVVHRVIVYQYEDEIWYSVKLN